MGHEFLGGQDTPLARAHQLLLRAYQERDGQRRVRLAQAAVEVCPDCADAYVLLTEHAKSRKEALQLYEKGVAAGERALGPEAFQQQVGHFWGLLETRPYMRARLGLAHSLWTAGRREEAVLHLQDMLRLNPGDNQGIRYTLAGFLLFLDRDDDLASLQAFEKTGRLVTEQNRHLLPQSALRRVAGRRRGVRGQARDEGAAAVPLGTVAMYGPDDRTTTKIAAGVIPYKSAEPVLKRWVGTDVMESPKVQQELREFFSQHGVKEVALSQGHLGCPHEEGEDCPYCPFWKGKQGSNRRD